MFWVCFKSVCQCIIINIEIIFSLSTKCHTFQRKDQLTHFIRREASLSCKQANHLTTDKSQEVKGLSYTSESRYIFKRFFACRLTFLHLAIEIIVAPLFFSFLFFSIFSFFHLFLFFNILSVCYLSPPGTSHAAEGNSVVHGNFQNTISLNI